MTSYDDERRALLHKFDVAKAGGKLRSLIIRERAQRGQIVRGGLLSSASPEARQRLADDLRYIAMLPPCSTKS